MKNKRKCPGHKHGFTLDKVGDIYQCNTCGGFTELSPYVYGDTLVVHRTKNTLVFEGADDLFFMIL